MEIPINTVAGPDNPNPAIHMVTQGHDIDIGSGGLRFGLDFLGMAAHGDCHTHVDALNHISYDGLDLQRQAGRLRCSPRRAGPRSGSTRSPTVAASSAAACSSTSRASAA